MSNPTGSEVYYKNHLDMVTKENKALKGKMERMERENRELKKSLYDLNLRCNEYRVSLGKDVKVFNIDGVLNNELPPTLMSQPAIDRQDEADKAKKKSDDGRRFYFKFNLSGHTGSVYSVQFAPNGKFLASGSFDKTIRLWDMQQQDAVAVLSEHNQNISDLCWSYDSLHLISAGSDHTIKFWDVQTGKSISSFECGGLVQCAKLNPADEQKEVVYGASTDKKIYIFDRREGTAAVGVIENDAMVNTLYLFQDGAYMTTGDAAGAVKQWDVRKRECFMENNDSKKPISHLAVSPPSKHGRSDEGRYMAANSYDNVVRVYDRGSFLLGSHSSGQTSTGLYEEKFGLTLMHSLTGHKNKNWPIKSSFFQGMEYRNAKDALEGTDLQENGSTEDIKKKTLRDTLLLATGSADNHAYLFDVGGPERSSQLVQRLEGHTDRVYAVDFHPQDPIMASGSADFSIKIWTPKMMGGATRALAT